MKISPLSQHQLPQATALYESAFPEYERRPTSDWQVMVEKQPGGFKAWAVTDENEAFCGFITTWAFPAFTYVEHFAISPEKRGAGIGGAAISILINECAGKPVVLEVEPPDTEMARRRIGFYRRHGLSLIPLPYLQPGYRPGAEWVPLPVMATNATWAEYHFEEIKRTLHREVYGVGRD